MPNTINFKEYSEDKYFQHISTSQPLQVIEEKIPQIQMDEHTISDDPSSSQQFDQLFNQSDQSNSPKRRRRKTDRKTKDCTNIMSI